MRIYNVMIVDDEAEVREGIAEQIGWGSMGFSVVAQAENGLEALEKAESCEVDVLLTDIKMPFMDGLTMVKEFRSLHPTAKVILFTGFDEVDYARRAIKLGVSEYVLKPVNVEELTSVMHRVREALDRETEQKRDSERLRALYEKALPSLKERFLGDLIWHRLPPAEIAQALKDYRLDIDAAPNKMVMVFEVAHGPEAEPSGGRELTQLSIQQLIEETLVDRCRFALFQGFSQVVAITAWQEEDPASSAVLLGNDICVRCRRILDVRLSCGVGGVYREIADTHVSYSGARAALEYRGIARYGKAIFIGDMERRPESRPFDSRYEKLLLSAVKFGAPEQIGTVIDDLMERMNRLSKDPWRRQAYLVSVFNALNRIIQQYDLTDEAELTGRTGDVLNLPRDDEKVRTWLTDICNDMFSHLCERRERAPRLLAEQAEAFIAAHCSESSLSAEEVCAHLHVSRSYFFSVFKKETGRSFVQFLTDMRLERALELLHDPDKKTYTIALAVGYEDPNYFSHVFKQRFGVTPAQYRRQGESG